MQAETLLQQVSRDLAAVHGAVAPSLVQVRRGGRGIGSGTVWSSDGLILTNAHVVESRGRVSGEVSVRLSDGRELAALVLAVARGRDLALLQVQTGGLAPIALGDSQTLAAGAWVMAFGFPYGVDDGATVGSVIAVGEGVPEGEAPRDREWLAAALHLRPGHSGGPMVDAQGRLVGINTMMNGPDVGVAVPVHVATGFVQSALAGRRAPPPTPSGMAWV